jgi:hypothetical protein
LSWTRGPTLPGTLCYLCSRAGPSDRTE